MNRIREKQIMERALSKFGLRGQLYILVEECSEVIKEIIKAHRGFDNQDALCEEIADVEILIGQVKLMYGDKIDRHRHKKLIRLEGLL